VLRWDGLGHPCRLAASGLARFRLEDGAGRRPAALVAAAFVGEPRSQLEQNLRGNAPRLYWRSSFRCSARRGVGQLIEGQRLSRSPVARFRPRSSAKAADTARRRLAAPPSPWGRRCRGFLFLATMESGTTVRCGRNSRPLMRPRIVLAPRLQPCRRDPPRSRPGTLSRCRSSVLRPLQRRPAPRHWATRYRLGFGCGGSIAPSRRRDAAAKIRRPKRVRPTWTADDDTRRERANKCGGSTRAESHTAHHSDTAPSAFVPLPSGL